MLRSERRETCGRGRWLGRKPATTEARSETGHKARSETGHNRTETGHNRTEAGHNKSFLFTYLSQEAFTGPDPVLFPGVLQTEQELVSAL